MHKILFITFFQIGIILISNHFAWSQTKDPLKVGVLLSLSGGLEQWCGYIRQGIELAVNGTDAETDLKFIFEDDRSLNRSATLTATQKLLHVDQVDLIYSWSASGISILIPVITRAKTPLLIGAYDNKVATGGAYVFGGFVNYSMVSKDIAEFFVSKGAKRLGLVLLADDWSQSFAEPFMAKVKELGSKVVINETILLENTDARSLILKLKKEKVDAVIAPLYGSSLYSFLRQAKELGYKGMINVGDGMFEEDLKIAGLSAEGVYAMQMWVESEELIAAMKSRYSADTNALQLGLVATGYDIAMHIKKLHKYLLSQGKQVSRENIREALNTFSSSGYTGQVMFGEPPEVSGEVNVVVSDGRYVRVTEE